MEKLLKSKIILGILISVIMVFALSSFYIVCADDVWPGTTETTTGSTESSSISDDGDPFDSGNWSTPSLENNTVNNSTNVSLDNNVNNSTNDIVFNTTNNTTTNKVNSTTSNSNSLAKTGIEDSNGMLAVILVVAGIVAIYSFKKINDYKNM